MDRYSDLKEEPGVISPGDDKFYRGLLRQHQTDTNPLRIFMEADPNNPQAVEYAGAVNMRLRALYDGSDLANAPTLPLPGFKPEAVRFSWRDRSGNIRNDQGVAQVNQQMHGVLNSQQQEVGQIFGDMLVGMAQAMKKAEDAPSDKLVSYIPHGQEYIVGHGPNGDLVVDSRNAAALAWGKKASEIVRQNGGVLNDANYGKIIDQRPNDGFPIGALEMRPPAHATAAQVKEANELNIGMHEMAQVFHDIEGGKHFVDMSAKTGTPPAARSSKPKMGAP